jgi:hypothetical protein
MPLKQCVDDNVAEELAESKVSELIEEHYKEVRE